MLEIRIVTTATINACALALLENQGSSLEVTKLVEYFSRIIFLHGPSHGFGLRWVAGSKIDGVFF
ncbi:MAG: hypothetical protein IPI57_18950 [Candidatus Competibacteraceae bacterium]|nr:hypothetical protein [Candidatus Competibacteraceae bacterium]